MQGQSYTWGADRGALTDANAGWGAASSSALREPTLQELEQRTEDLSQSIAASQKRMMQMAQNAEQTGAATLAELNAQGETIKRIQKDQAEVEANLET